MASRDDGVCSEKSVEIVPAPDPRGIGYIRGKELDNVVLVSRSETEAGSNTVSRRVQVLDFSQLLTFKIGQKETDRRIRVVLALDNVPSSLGSQKAQVDAAIDTLGKAFQANPEMST